MHNSRCSLILGRHHAASERLIQSWYAGRSTYKGCSSPRLYHLLSNVANLLRHLRFVTGMDEAPKLPAWYTLSEESARDGSKGVDRMKGRVENC